ncbi:MAG: peptidoglycan DD-metalloendopeptidase family protein [Desulfobacteraceae bacterium]|nr:peptidoglycan DD-metalloendopeptidase family protein [Desulfobacteraceae bacterium]
MKPKFTVFVLSDSGTPVTRKSLSRRALYLLAATAAVVILASVAIFCDYLRLRSGLIAAHRDAAQIARQKEEIHHQRRQIQRFAADINHLKNRVAALDVLEQEIRAAANLSEDGDQEGIFGVGGPPPDDLDTELALAERHNSLMRDMHAQVSVLKRAAGQKQQDLETLLSGVEAQRNLLARTPTILPAKGWISSRFGYRKSPFGGRREFHKGVDIAAKNRSPVVATADGVVTFSGAKAAYGKTIVIDHGHGIVTSYAHLSKTLVKAGRHVKRGDTVGLVGSTGRSTGPHLHYEVRLNGMPVNPQKYVLR